MTTPRRRLADKVIEAFEQACEEREIAIAQELFWALEAAVSRAGSPGGVERRNGYDYILQASVRLERLKNEVRREMAETTAGD